MLREDILLNSSRCFSVPRSFPQFLIVSGYSTIFLHFLAFLSLSQCFSLVILFLMLFRYCLISSISQIISYAFSISAALLDFPNSPPYFQILFNVSQYFEGSSIVIILLTYSPFIVSPQFPSSFRTLSQYSLLCSSYFIPHFISI